MPFKVQNSFLQQKLIMKSNSLQLDAEVGN